MSELMAMQKEIEEHIGSDLIPSGARIHALVERSFKAVGISKVRLTFLYSVSNILARNKN